MTWGDKAGKLPRHKQPKRREYQKKWAKENLNNASAKAKAAYRAWKYHIKKKYGITDIQYAELLSAQDGVCAICFKRPTKRRLAVDHDHKTGKIRGLLCYPCNYFILGRTAKAELLFKAFEYLKRAEEAEKLVESNGQATTIEQANLS